MEDLLERWQESERRSRERRAKGGSRPARRRRGTLIGVAVGVAAVVIGGAAIGAPESDDRNPRLDGLLLDAAVADPGVNLSDARVGPPGLVSADNEPVGGEAAKPGRPPRKVPSAAALRDAWSYAQQREGLVSVAVVDSEGELRGRDINRRYAAASVVKSMLLAAELRRLKQSDEGIDPSTDALLTAMITYSDNGAADAIYARVGDDGLFRAAKRAGMKRFTVAGYWGNAQIAAGDMARFFGNLDRALVRKYREYGKGLLGSVTESQRWGIPAAAGDKWAVRFKGGWLPDHALVHQAAELREREGNRELSIVVLTDEQPSFADGIETVRGVSERLLSPRRGGA